MCGIAGMVPLISQDVDSSDLVRRMTAGLAHRGPDDCGFARFSETGIVLGFRRLSIRDVSELAHQPMQSADRNMTLVFNGEIYNTEELIRRYLPGVAFRSSGDAEVLLRLCQSVGIEEAAGALDGIFTFAIYDSRERVLYITRDGLGVKPLYHRRDARSFYFASEIKALLTVPGSVPFDREWISEYAVFRYAAEPRTPFSGIEAFEPGVIARISDGRVDLHWRELRTKRRYRHHTAGEALSGTDRAVGFDETVCRMESCLKQSVSDQLVSDVPLGIQLSGGIDSSLIAFYAKQLQPGIEAFAVIPDDPALSEEKYIDRVSEVTGIRVHKYRLSSRDLVSRLLEAVWYHETPINHGGSLGIYHVCAEASRHVKVLLSGEGADELFAGYQRYGLNRRLHAKFCLQKHLSRWQGFWKPAASWIERLSNRGQPMAREVQHLSYFGRADWCRRIWRGFSMDAAISTRDELFGGFDWEYYGKNILIYDQLTYLRDLLMRQDKLSMAHGVETRVPYLSRDMVLFSDQIPHGYNFLAGGSGKAMQKTLAARYFGNDFAFRRKVGFPIPITFLLRESDFKAYLKSCIRPLLDGGVVLREGADRVFRASEQGDAYAVRALAILAYFAMWHDLYFDSARSASRYFNFSIPAAREIPAPTAV